MKKQKNLTFIVFSMLVMMFQSPLSMSSLPEAVTIIIKNYEEIFTVVIAIFIVLRFVRTGIPKEYTKELVMFILFLITGFLGTIINNLQPIGAVIEDLVNCSKFFIVFLGISILYKSSTSKQLLNILQRISVVVTLVLFMLTIVDIVMPQLLFDNAYIRYGIHAVHLFYYHPALLSHVMVLLLSILSVGSIGVKNINLYKMMCLLIIASTLRSKAFGFICLYAFVWLFDKNKTKTIRILLAVLVILMIIFVSFDSIKLYYGGENSARATLTIDSVSIANNNIPLGLGYGTFASASASKYYSPVYEKLGYESRYGMGYINNDYLTDSFWPVIIGEFGYIGLLAYASIIVILAKKSIVLFKKNRKLGISAVSIVGYLLICSTSATAFFNPMAVPNGIILALIFNVACNKKNNILKTHTSIHGVHKNGYR